MRQARRKAVCSGHLPVGIGRSVNREFGAYDSIRDNFPKYVVSLDEFDMSRNGIKHRNIRDFLLAEEWN